MEPSTLALKISIMNVLTDFEAVFPSDSDKNKIPLDPRSFNHKETANKYISFKHYLIVSVAGNFDAGFSDFHINY